MAKSKRPKQLVVRYKETDKNTGEIFEGERVIPEDIGAVRDLWIELTKEVKVLEGLKKRLREHIEANYLDDSGEADAGAGYKFKLSSAAYTSYDVHALNRVLDPDTFIDLVKADNAKVKAYLKEGVKRGDIDPAVSKELANTKIIDRVQSVFRLDTPA